MRDGQEPSDPLSGRADAAEDTLVLPNRRTVLTPEEIDALLRPTAAPADQAPSLPTPQEVKAKPTPVFDEAAAATDRHARTLGSKLSAALARGTGLKAAVMAVETATLAREDLPPLMTGKSAAIACIGPTETEIKALICLPPLCADAIIANACGARGSTGRIGDGWSLSAIDCALLKQLLEPLGPAMAAGMTLQLIETDVPYVTSLLPAVHVNISEFSIEAQGLHTELAVIETDLKPGSGASVRDATRPKEAPVMALATARLASLSVPLSRVTALKAGATLLLGLPPDQPVELLSGGRDGPPIYEGRMGRKGNKVALKVMKRLRPLSRD
ncbi:MAG: FliM/FliN family flagellar motor C-terminal domain-containing protein [Pseudomonadota bacterium]